MAKWRRPESDNIDYLVKVNSAMLHDSHTECFSTSAMVNHVLASRSFVLFFMLYGCSRTSGRVRRFVQYSPFAPALTVTAGRTTSSDDAISADPIQQRSAL